MVYADRHSDDAAVRFFLRRLLDVAGHVQLLAAVARGLVLALALRLKAGPLLAGLGLLPLPLEVTFPLLLAASASARLLFGLGAGSLPPPVHVSASSACLPGLGLFLLRRLGGFSLLRQTCVLFGA